MKVGIIGAGFVGTACAKSLLLRGVCHDIVLIDIDERRAKGVATDLSHGAVLCLPTRITHGGYDDIADASVIVITAGINEREGKAIDRNDPRGRLLLLPDNARIYDHIMPQLVRVAPQAPIIIVTDPPDALADIARRYRPGTQIISSGTYLDSIRLRYQIARRLHVAAASVRADVIGEHGTSQVYVWSTASVGGISVLSEAQRLGHSRDTFRTEVEAAVRHANIDIIEGTGASQHGIGIVTMRMVEAILRDADLVEPIGIPHPEYGVTISLPSVIGRGGIKRVLQPSLTEQERASLELSATAIRNALDALT